MPNVNLEPEYKNGHLPHDPKMVEAVGEAVHRFVNLEEADEEEMLATALEMLTPSADWLRDTAELLRQAGDRNDLGTALQLISFTRDHMDAQMKGAVGLLAITGLGLSIDGEPQEGRPKDV